MNLLDLKIAIQQKTMELDQAMEEARPHDDLYTIYKELKSLHQQYERLQHELLQTS